jgi:Rrf2 family protein
MLQLKAAGLVESTRGAAGGYRLTRDPALITLGEVKAIIEGPCGELVSSIAVPSAASALLLDTWKEIDACEREKLAQITFEDLVERQRGTVEKMYYI